MEKNIFCSIVGGRYKELKVKNFCIFDYIGIELKYNLSNKSLRKPVIYLIFKYGIWLANARCNFYSTIFFKDIESLSTKARNEAVVFLVFPLKLM